MKAVLRRMQRTITLIQTRLVAVEIVTAMTATVARVAILKQTAIAKKMTAVVVIAMMKILIQTTIGTSLDGTRLAVVVVVVGSIAFDVFVHPALLTLASIILTPSYTILLLRLILVVRYS